MAAAIAAVQFEPDGARGLSRQDFVAADLAVEDTANLPPGRVTRMSMTQPPVPQ